MTLGAFFVDFFFYNPAVRVKPEQLDNSLEHGFLIIQIYKYTNIQLYNYLMVQ